MRTRMMRLGSLLVLLALILLGGCATGNYVPKANEELYQTWTNESMDAQKTVNSPGVFKDYAKITDTNTIQEGKEDIFSKWTDSDGNVWYKTYGVITTGQFAGVHFQTLSKISKSGTVREFVVVVPVYHFDPLNYPPAPDPRDPSYHIYYRAKE